jgi:Cucumopine synthase C-terminal helical bundle domain
MTVDDVIKELETERERIWLECPQEVKDLANGIVPRGTGSKGQYFSTLIFAEGEARTLSDEMLWGILQVADDKDTSLPTLKAVIRQIISYKADFFDFVGLPQAGALIHRYVEAADKTTSLEELVKLTGVALSYANRFHMWVDAVFPWGLGNGFKRADRRVA